MSLELVRAVAASLVGVTEKDCNGLRRWDVADRLMARQLDAETVVIRSGFTAREELLRSYPDTFTVPPRFDAHMMVVAELDGDQAALARALHEAYELQTNA